MLLSSLLLCPTLFFNDLLLSALLCSQSLLCSSPTITVGGNSCLCTLLSCVALHGTGGGLNGRVMGGWGSARSPHSSPLRLRSLHLSTSEGGHQATSPHIYILGINLGNLGIGRQPLRGTFHVSTSWEQLHHFCISKTSSPPPHF